MSIFQGQYVYPDGQFACSPQFHENTTQECLFQPYRQVPPIHHSQTPAKFSLQQAYQHPQDNHFVPHCHYDLHDQSQHAVSMNIDEFFARSQAQMRASDHEEDYYRQQEELSYQDHIQQQKVEAQRRHEELLAEKVALKEEQMRLAITR